MVHGFRHHSACPAVLAPQTDFCKIQVAALGSARRTSDRQSDIGGTSVSALETIDRAIRDRVFGKSLEHV